MDLRLLETFRTVIETRSATQAAAAMGVTQPAVSGQIARLEEAVGFALFERAGGRLKPTSEALLFYAEASRALSGFDRLNTVAEHIRGGRTGRLTIASHPSAAISLLPEVIAGFVQDRPEVSVRLVTRDSHVVRSLLPSESFDIGIAEWPITDHEVKVSRFRLRCVAVLAPHHDLAGRDVLSPAHLSGVPFITTFRARLVHDRVRRAFAEAGCDWNVCAETEFFASACGLAASGAGVAIIDPYTAASFEKLGLVARPFEPTIFYEIGLFHSLGRELSVIARSFWDVISARLAAIAESGERHAARIVGGGSD